MKFVLLQIRKKHQQWRCAFSNLIKIKNPDKHFPKNNHISPVLNTRVLVLNQIYEPLTICSAQKAIVLLYLTKAEMIAERKDKLIHSAHSTHACPSVIKLNSFKRNPFRYLEISRRNVLKRDNYTCQYCGSKSATITIDHVLPKSRGGGDTWENLVAACFKCNNIKGDKTPIEAGMKLLQKPYKPNYFTFMTNSLGKDDANWRQFMYY